MFHSFMILLRQLGGALCRVTVGITAVKYLIINFLESFFSLLPIYKSLQNSRFLNELMRSFGEFQKCRIFSIRPALACEQKPHAIVSWNVPILPISIIRRYTYITS